MGIGPIKFNLYGLILGIAIWAGLEAALSKAKELKIKTDDINSAFWWAVLGGIVGARLYHVIDLWDEVYSLRPERVFYLWQGGLAIWGAIIGGAGAIAIFSKLKKEDFFSLADLAAVGIPLGQAIGRWGNYINSELIGKVSRWGFEHPLFFYESLLNFGLFLCLWRIKKYRRGIIISSYLIGYGLIRISMEGLRKPGDVWYWGSAPAAVVISLLGLVVGMAIRFFLKENVSGKQKRQP